ncbi:hypothetical protein SAMN04488128_10321 [Chitinophaga eiseniae]|uniref:Uncharacterized protein n=1 Tax=Chitinophaga eiseniae TaxID=634771 RepID=A0A1T4SKA0_9BACT|nr:hypothetical protein [Chitinophaga eiseniae]SKA28720.1 hypothetical protein SAMN04488128_10321 [Chitinophaga eiseniae]
MSSLQEFALNSDGRAEPVFLAQLIPFAQANGSGSFYALWQHNDSTDLNELPVGVFGDEGGEYGVAENLNRFLQLLTIDAEPMIFDGVNYFREQHPTGHFRRSQAAGTAVEEQAGHSIPAGRLYKTYPAGNCHHYFNK